MSLDFFQRSSFLQNQAQNFATMGYVIAKIYHYILDIALAQKQSDSFVTLALALAYTTILVTTISNGFLDDLIGNHCHC